MAACAILVGGTYTLNPYYKKRDYSYYDSGYDYTSTYSSYDYTGSLRYYKGMFAVTATAAGLAGAELCVPYSSHLILCLLFANAGRLL